MPKNSIPNGWINCPAKSDELIEGLFLPFKTPLSRRYNHKIPSNSHFTMTMLLNDTFRKNINLGLIINLTDTNRYYDPNFELKDNNIEFKKIFCTGHRAPNVQQTRMFIDTCYDYLKNNPSSIVGVHCTHGFNRTGFLICAYLIEKLNFSVVDAVKLFAACRPPGIYRQNIVNELYYRYGTSNDIIPEINEKPSWKEDH